MIAFGESCNFGDQLDLSGEMELETYQRIRHAFEYVEQIEDYGVDGRPVCVSSIPHRGQSRRLGDCQQNCQQGEYWRSTDGVLTGFYLSTSEGRCHFPACEASMLTDSDSRLHS